MVEEVALNGKYVAYPDYKDSEVEWLGAVPSGWSVMQLRRITHLQQGLQISQDKRFHEAGVNRVEYITIKYLNSKDSSQAEYILSASDRVLCDEDDILLARTGATGQVVTGVNGAFHNNFFKVNYDKNKVTKEFLVYFLNVKEVLGHLLMLAGTTTIPDLNHGAFLGTKIALPDFMVQAGIIEFLDHETAKIDTLIEKQQQLIALLKEKRQAVISHAVTKGLNPNAPMKNSGVEWLGEVPEHWVVCKLKHIIASLESGVSVNAADLPAQDDEFGVLKTSCVYTRSFRVEENKTVVKEEYDRVKCPIRKGAIIISRMNTPDLVGASAIVDIEGSNIFLPDRLWQTVFQDEDRQNPKFIAYFMMIKGFRNQISLAAEGASSSMQNIAKDDYLSINIAFPNLVEQGEIVCFLEKRLCNFNILENRASMAIKLLQERRTALISAAVTGKIDVRNWQAD